MRPERGYIKTTINDTPYLLPYGQQIADHHPGIRLNQSGSLLWDALYEGADNEELLNILIDHYQADNMDLPLLKKDLELYLNMLSENKLLNQNETVHPRPYEEEFFFRIGPLTFAFHGPRPAFPSFLEDFSCQRGPVDQTISFHYGRPQTRRNGEILVRNEHVIIAADETSYILIYSETSLVYEVHIRKDGTNSCLYCIPPFDEKLLQSIFHAIRFSFLVLAQQHDLYVLHSASILYQDKAWLFSGKSGTGKSTHAALWQSLYETPVLNGDLNLIGMEDGKPVVYGFPWCGTSEIYTTKTHPLGGIVFLKQAAEEHLSTLSSDEKTLFFLQRMISPTWTPELLLKNLSFAKALADTIPMLRLFCTKEPESASLMKETIDHLKQDAPASRHTSHK